MSIDLEKNRNAILKAFNDVVSDKTKTDWALFGYEGHTNVLKLVGTGEDGIEEMAEDLNSSKIMYATVRVLDPNTTRPKVILINWQGEGAPTLLKGRCARHLNDVNKFLCGVHVTISARTEEEVEPEVIMSAVLKASASTYNFNERSEISDKTTPVGTNYKRTNPLAEINTKSRNRFWEEQEAEERKRKNLEISKRNEELQQLENERKQREINEAKHREVLTKERNARICAEHKAEDDAARRLAAKDDKKWQADLQTQYVEEQERAKRAEMMRLERKKEAESLIGNRTHNTRAMFESGNTTSQQTAETNRPPPRKLKEFKPAHNNERVENNESATVLPIRGVTARWPPANTTAQNEDTSPNQNKDKVTTASSTNIRTTSAVPTIKQQTQVQAQHIPQQTVLQQHVPQPQIPQPQIPQPQIPQPQIPQPQIPQPQIPQPQIPQPQISQPQIPQLPVTQQPVHGVVQPQAVQPQAVQHQAVQPLPEAVQSIQEESFDRQSSSFDRKSSQPQSVFTNGDVSSDIYDTTTVPNKTSNETDYQVYENSEETYSATICATDDTLQNNSTTPAIGMVYEVDGMEYQILPEHGLCARALYDYQAADDTEITFDPEEIITNIDQIDAGWWQGVGPDGTFGLFPANYVELINQSNI